MYGFSISLLMDVQNHKENVNEEFREKVPNIIWSDYDRIHIQKSEKFEDFVSMDNLVSCWTGKIQTLHLYSIESNSSTVLGIKDNSTTHIIDQSSPDKTYPLAMIMSLKINEDIHESLDIIKKISNVILDKSKIILEGNPIQSYFSLGEEDLVLIALGDSIDTFMALIKMVRELKFKFDQSDKTESYICDFSNSFFVQNSEDLSDVRCEKAFINTYFSLDKSINENDFIKAFKKEIYEEPENCTILVGEYDVVIRLNNKKGDLFDVFNPNKKNSLLAKSEFYKNNIKNSKTVWCVESESINLDSKDNSTLIIDKIQKSQCSAEDSGENNILNNKICNTITKINEKYDKVNNLNTKYLYQNFIYFLKDAAIAYNSATTLIWKDILFKQISSVIDTFLSYDEEDNDKMVDFGEQFLIDFNETITDMRNSFSHINRSREMFYHTSIPSLNYLGSFNVILLSYYNYINMLLNLTYQKPHSKNTRQAKITFFVYFGMTSKIRSKIYFNDYYSPNEDKLVGFELPYAALFDLKKYLISLTHEVYHLIAPCNREKRNYQIIEAWEDDILLTGFVECAFEEIKSLINCDDSEIEIEVKALLKEYYSDNCRYFNDSNVYYSKLDYVSLNRIIKDNLLNYRNEVYGYYKKSFSGCVDYYKKKVDSKKFNKAEKIISEINSDLLDLNKHYINSERINKLNAIIQSIKECICDTFMYQMSFARLDNAENEYIRYMINFFDERKINYSKTMDAILRIGMFLDYIDYNFAESKLEKDLLSQIKQVRGEYINRVGEYRDFIKYMIMQDDFLVLANLMGSEYYSKTMIQGQQIFEFISSVNDDGDMSSCISLIERISHMRTQVDFDSVANKNTIELTSSKKSKKINPLDISPTVYISNINDYLNFVSNRSENKTIWYRGICNTEYKLIPSLYVKLPEGEFPYAFQNSLIRQSYDNTKKNYHVFSKHETPSAMRQSLMQHYGVATNLLDFSTDPIAALFWALNPENEKDKNKYCPAVVYFFYPHKYNKVYNFLKKYYKCEGYKYVDQSYAIRSHKCLNSEYIISDTSDAELMSKAAEFNENMNKYKKYRRESSRKKMMYNSLPIPIVISQKNDRILAQSGTFVAFNMCGINTEKNLSSQGYDYQSLESIQKEYIEICKKEDIEYKNNLFYERVIINDYAVSLLRNAINNTFKYSIESVYPDLYNQLKSVNDDVMENLKNN